MSQKIVLIYGTIIDHRRRYRWARKNKDFRDLLIEKFPDFLSDKQKEKMGNKLSAMKRKGMISCDSDNQQTGFGFLRKSIRFHKFMQGLCKNYVSLMREEYEKTWKYGSFELAKDSFM